LKINAHAYFLWNKELLTNKELWCLFNINQSAVSHSAKILIHNSGIDTDIFYKGIASPETKLGTGMIGGLFRGFLGAAC
jgi:hypothetical protein